MDREATKFIGLTIPWDYDNGKVHIHMPGYLDKAMMRFKHEIPTKVQNSPHRHIEVKYGAKKQFVDEEMDPPPLSKEQAKYIQAVIGTLLLLWEGSQPHYSPGPQFHRHKASKTDGENKGDGKTIVRLLCNTGGCYHHIHSQQNDLMHTQQRGLCQ